MLVTGLPRSLDLGSGVGSLVVAVSTLAGQQGFLNVGSCAGVEKRLDLHQAGQTWLREAGRANPCVAGHCDAVASSLHHVDLLSTNPQDGDAVASLLRKANVVFSNNLLFPALLNNRMSELLSLRSSTLAVAVVTTAPLSPGSGKLNVAFLQNIVFPPASMSWTATAVTGYVYTLEAREGVASPQPHLRPVSDRISRRARGPQAGSKRRRAAP